MNSPHSKGPLWASFPGMPKGLLNLQISGSVLKWIAIITMFIDHFTVAVTGRLLRMEWVSHKQEIHSFYKICRGIGRLGFPLFCFLLVEGLLHTKNRWKYALRLFLFCFLSEIPFDIALFNSWVTWEHQNVFMTLFIGYMTIWAIDETRIRLLPKYKISIVLIPGVVAAAYYLANFLHTDYRGYGVLTIVTMYMFSFNYTYSLFVGLIVLYGFNSSEMPAFFALIPMSFYNGTRGKQPKYFFYFFYPVHLFLVYLLAVIFGLT